MTGLEVLRTLANELPTVLRQIESGDPVLNRAGLMRLDDFGRMLAPWRVRRVSRRGLLRGAGAVTFAAMSIQRDD